MQHPTKIVGIVNLTPDSFSDGGLALNDAVARVHALADAGADMIDIGAESTRPGAVALSADEEWARLSPVLSQVAKKGIAISIDTYHVETAKRALDAGVQIINDVGGLRDDAMCALLAQHDCGIISMHALSLPVKKDETLDASIDLGIFLRDWVSAQKERLSAFGIAHERVTFDPGLGFGKSAVQSFHAMNYVLTRDHMSESWLIGHSRKSFLNLFEQRDAADRDGLTRSLSAMMMARGVAYIRVHDVAGHVALRKALT